MKKAGLFLNDMGFIRLKKYTAAFQRLQNIVNKDLYINGGCFRILAINLLDYGIDWQIKKHKHTFFESCYITENTTLITMSGNEYSIGPNEFYILPPGTFHSHRQEPGTAHVGIGIRWEFVSTGEDYTNVFSGMKSLFDSLRYIDPRPKKDENGDVRRHILNLLDMAEGGADNLELQLEFLKLVLFISKFCLPQPGMADKANRNALSENKAITSALRFLEENYAQEISAMDVAKFVYLSYSQLYRLFMKHTGLSVNEYLNKFRISKAQQLLLCTDMSITQIAGASGFHNEQYFSRVFKKVCGLAPRAYRASKAQLSE